MTTPPTQTDRNSHASLLVAITRKSILLSIWLMATWALVSLISRYLPLALPELPEGAVWLGVALPALFGMVLSLYTVAAHPGYLPERLTYKGR